MKNRFTMFVVIVFMCVFLSNAAYAACNHDVFPRITTCDRTVRFIAPCTAISGCTGETVYCYDAVQCPGCNQIIGWYFTDHLCADIGHSTYPILCPIGNYNYCPY